MANANEMKFADESHEYNILKSVNPIVTEMITSDAKVKIWQMYHFWKREFNIESAINYYENGVDGGSSENDHNSTTNKTYNYHGQLIIDIVSLIELC